MTHENQTLADRAVVLQEIQPGVLGLMDGSVSTWRRSLQQQA